MNRKVNWRLILFLSLALAGGGLLVTACSSPGAKKAGEDCTSTYDCESGLICSSAKCAPAIAPPEAQAPVANAGADIDGITGQKVTLNGEKSSSREGKDLKFSWTLKGPSGSTATLEGADSKSPSFTPDKEGDYTATLKVNDGKDSEADTVGIKVVRANKAPKADAGPASRRIELGNKVDLDASKSSDEDKDTLEFKWEVIARPDGSTASLGDNAAAKTDITPDKLGTYGIRLTVKDGRASDSTTVFVEVVVNNPLPEISKLTPGWGPAKAADFKVKIEGKNFLFGAKATLDGKDAKALQYESPTELIATFDLSTLAPGDYDVVVKNPDEKSAKPAKFKVQDAAAPVIKTVSPSLLITGQSLRFVVEGENFLNGSTVSFDGKDLTTEFIKETELQANLPLAPTTGEYDLKVKSPDGKESNTVKVTVTGVQAILKDMSLGRIGSDCAKETVNISGQNIMSDATVEIRSKADPTKVYKPTKTTVKSLTEIEFEADFTKIPKGEYEVVVLNKGTQASLGLPFTVTDPPGKPRALSVFPTNILVGDTGKVIVVGLNLDKSTGVEIGGKIATARQINSTTYEVPIDASQMMSAGKITLKLTASCGRKSDDIEVNAVDEGEPKILQLIPDSLDETKVEDVAVHGTGFGVTAKVWINGKEIQNAKRDSASLIIIPKGNFPAKGDYKIQIENKGGKKSNEAIIKVDKKYDLLIELVDVGFSSSSLYIKGKGIRKDEDPGKTIANVVLFYDTAGKQICTKDGFTTYDSATSGYIYISSFYSKSCDLTDKFVDGQTYIAQVKKDDKTGGKVYLSNPKSFVYKGGSTSSSSNLPYLTKFYNGSGPGYAGTAPSTVKLELYGSNFGSSGDPLDLYINGKKVDATTDTNFKQNARYSYRVDYTISRQAVGVYAVELVTKAGKSNTLFMSFDATAVPRLKHTSTSRMVQEQGDVYSPYVYGDYLSPRGDFSLFIAGKEFVVTSTTSSSSNYYLYYSYSDIEKHLDTVKLGQFPVYAVNNKTKVKTNELTYNLIKKGEWGTLALNIMGMHNTAVRLGDKHALIVSNLGFVEDDGNGKKGEVLVGGTAQKDFKVTAPTTSNTGYVTLKEQSYDTAGVWPVQLKNPDGKATKELLFSVVKPGQPMIKNYGTSYTSASRVSANSQTALTLSVEGVTAKTEVYFAGRPATVASNDGASIEVNIDTRGVPPGLQALWLWDKDKGSSNTILVNVLAEGFSTSIPRFYSFAPAALRTTEITAASNKVRFFVYGSSLTESLELVIDKKGYKLVSSGSASYSIAEADLTGLAKGKYDAYLRDPGTGFESPKLKLDVE